MSVPLPVLGLDLKDQDTLTLLTMCLWGEARNQPEEGVVAVAHVVRNRVLSGKWGDTWRDVLLAPKQFSCFNPNDLNRIRMMEPQRYGTLGIWNRCAEAAEKVYKGEVADPTFGADHYHTVRRPKGVSAWPPKWAKAMKQTVVIGDHRFLKS